MTRILQYYLVRLCLLSSFFSKCWVRLSSSIILVMSSFELMQIVHITRYDEWGLGPVLSRRFACQMLIEGKGCGKTWRDLHNVSSVVVFVWLIPSTRHRRCRKPSLLFFTQCLMSKFLLVPSDFKASVMVSLSSLFSSCYPFIWFLLLLKETHKQLFPEGKYSSFHLELCAYRKSVSFFWQYQVSQ